MGHGPGTVTDDPKREDAASFAALTTQKECRNYLWQRPEQSGGSKAVAAMKQ